MIWSNIGKYQKHINNGVKKIDGLNELNDLKKTKTKTKHKYKMKHLKDDFILNEKSKFKSFNIKTNPDLQNLFNHKIAISKILKNGPELGNGSKNTIQLFDNHIPKINHSYVDPQYYQHKLQNKSNTNIIKNNMSKGKNFAATIVAGLGATPISTPPTTPRGNLEIQSLLLNQNQTQEDY